LLKTTDFGSQYSLLHPVAALTYGPGWYFLNPSVWFDSELPTTIYDPRYKMSVHGGFEDFNIGTTHGHGNFERSFSVPGMIQKFVRALFRKEIQLDKLGIVEYELNLRTRSLCWQKPTWVRVRNEASLPAIDRDRSTGSRTPHWSSPRPYTSR
jgi:hypothetical protein